MPPFKQKRKLAGNPGGRPTLYKDEYPKMLFEHMKGGLSFESFAGVIQTGRETLYGWLTHHPEFSDAKKAGTEASLLFWEQLGKAQSIGDPRVKGAAQAVYIFTMKNKHGWTDKQEVTNVEKVDGILFTDEDPNEG